MIVKICFLNANDDEQRKKRKRQQEKVSQVDLGEKAFCFIVLLILHSSGCLDVELLSQRTVLIQ